MQEQNVLFMASLWLYAVFVSPSDATDLGYAYLVLRSMYPVVWAVLGGEKGMPEAGSTHRIPSFFIPAHPSTSQHIPFHSPVSYHIRHARGGRRADGDA